MIGKCSILVEPSLIGMISTRKRFHNKIDKSLFTMEFDNRKIWMVYKSESTTNKDYILQICMLCLGDNSNNVFSLFYGIVPFAPFREEQAYAMQGQKEPSYMFDIQSDLGGFTKLKII